ncbi:MAG: T9SS type A sorting domain-containing protein [Candidatus Cloacimonadota bacterium]|nr:T9SS type A sorting domain-containing protein [Candidatus Cloacimonadota bacterium]
MKRNLCLTVFVTLLLSSSVLFGTIIEVPDDQATIQLGIDAAIAGDTVLVHPGTYVENLTCTKNITIASLFITTQDTSYLDSTIIDGSQTAGVFIFTSCDTTARLTGFSITNGNASDSYGGGIFLNDSDPKLDNLKIFNNTATYDGGGIICIASSPTISKVLIYGNTTEWHGGAICAYNNSSVSLDHVTTAYNIAASDGSNLACLYNSSFSINNSVVWNGSPLNGIYTVSSGNVTATYSDIYGGTGQSYFGTGCIDSNPLFANASAGNFHLTWANMPTPDSTKSPCIDTGDPDTSLDPDGTRADMGMYSYHQTGITGVVTLNGGSGSVEDALLIATLSSTGDTISTANPDASGNYLLNLEAETYDLVVSLSGYVTKTYTNLVVSNQLITQDVTLSPPQPGEIIGKVDIDEGIGNVLEAEITAGDETVNPYRVYDFNDIFLYYEYTIEIISGTYDVVATLAGYSDSTIVNVPVEPTQQTTDQDFVLQLIKFEGDVTGTITLIDGTGNVEDVTVSADTTSCHPDANGDYVLTLLNGTYDVTAALDEYTSITIEDVEVYSDQATEDVDMTLINWNVIPGTQFVTTYYATTSQNGEFVLGTDPNTQMVAIGPASATDYRGIAEWHTGNHPLWCTDLHYYSLDGYWYITIVSNDNSTTETINFKLYNSEDDSLYTCNESIFFYDDPDTCDYTAADFTLPSENDTLQFDLTEDWNWISFNSTPGNTATSTVFNELTPADIYQVKNRTQSYTYFNPGGWVGGLVNLSEGDGYLVNMHNSYDDFTYVGKAINPIVSPLDLSTSWNWIAYLPKTANEISVALASISSKATCIKTQTQSAVYDAGWFGDLTQLEPQKAYKICMTEEENLTFPANSANRTASSVSTIVISNSAGWELMSGTPFNMIAMTEIYLGESEISNPEKYEVGVFDLSGNCRSVGVRTNGVWYFTIIGEIEGEQLIFKLYDALNETEYSSENQITFSKDSIEGSSDSPFAVHFEGNENSIEKFVLYNASPNPFKASTEINYQIAEPVKVSISIYNILGQKVRTLINEEVNTGIYSGTWNGEDSFGNAVPNGIYFYKIETNKFSSVKKLLKLN